jgi:hypothetical protein
MEDTVAKLQRQLSKLSKRVSSLEAKLSEVDASGGTTPNTNQVQVNNNSGKTITLTKDTSKSVLITGQTYDLRQAIKDQGGKWEKDVKGWKIPSSGLDLVTFEQELTETGVKIVKVGWDKETVGKGKKAVKMKITKSSKDTSANETPVECTILSDSDSD